MLADDDLVDAGRGPRSRRRISAPAPITSTRPGCMTGSAARSSWVIASSRAVTSAHVGRPGRGRGGCGPGRTPAGPSAIAATVVTEPASPTRVRASASGTVSPASRDRRLDVGAGRRRPAPAVGGSSCRCRSVIRTQPTSTDRAAAAPRRVAEHELGRAAADVDDEERRGPGSLPASSRVAPAKDSAASSSPGDDLGLDAEPVARRRRRTRRGSPRRGTRRWRRTGPARRRCARTTSAYSSQRGEGARPAPPGRAGRCGRRPAPSRTISIRRSTSVSVAGVGVDVGDEQPDRVGAAVDRGDPGHGARPGADDARARCATSRAARPSASSPSGFTPGPAASDVRDEHVQALHPVRHAAGRDAGDLRHRLDRVPRARGSARAPRR